MDKKIEVTTEELKALGADIQKATDERVEAVEKKFADAIKGIETSRKFTGDDSAKLAGKEKSAKFIQALKRQDGAALKAMNEGTGSAGGFVVPEEFAAEINRVVEDFVDRYENVGVAGLNYYITRSTTNFVICSTNAAGAGQSFGFDYIILG